MDPWFDDNYFHFFSAAFDVEFSRGMSELGMLDAMDVLGCGRSLDDRAGEAGLSHEVESTRYDKLSELDEVESAIGRCLLALTRQN